MVQDSAADGLRASADDVVLLTAQYEGEGSGGEEEVDERDTAAKAHDAASARRGVLVSLATLACSVPALIGA